MVLLYKKKGYLFLSNAAARSQAAASLADETASQHSDQSDTRTEQSDEDVGEKTPKRGTSTKTTKKPAAAAAKTEVSVCACVYNVHHLGSDT